MHFGNSLYDFNESLHNTRTLSAEFTVEASSKIWRPILRNLESKSLFPWQTSTRQRETIVEGVNLTREPSQTLTDQ